MSEKNPKKIEVICEMSTNGKTIQEIADHFCCSTGYISRILTDNGIHHKSNLPSDEVIIESYKKTLSSNKTADELKINQKSVLKILHRNNITTNGIQNYRLNAERYNREIQEEIKTLYESNISTIELQKKFGGSVSTICQAIVRMGGKIRPPQGKKPKILTEEQEQEICNAYVDGASQVEVANKYNYGQTTISRILIKNGIRTKQRQKHGNYKEGKAWHHQGYVYIWIEPNDPLAIMRTRGGYVLEHRLNLARKLNRPLTSDETVHHINGIRHDNKLENLQLCQGKHGKGQCLQCFECKSIDISTNEFIKCNACGSFKVSFTEMQ